MSASSSSSWVGRPQPAAGPGAHRAGASVAAAHITGPPGLPIQLLVELVERTEDQSTRAEEHREHRLLRQDSGREQSFLSLTRSNPFTMKSQLLPEGAYEVHNHELGLADADTGMMILADTG